MIAEHHRGIDLKYRLRYIFIMTVEIKRLVIDEIEFTQSVYRDDNYNLFP